MKRLPLGTITFTKLRNDDRYYIDKSPFIKVVLENDADVLLLTRPRRFGKTLFMDSLGCFLEIDPEFPGCSKKNAELFSGLKILEDKEFCSAHMGQFPVVSLSFKEIQDNNFWDAYQSFASFVSSAAGRYNFLLESSRLDANEKERLAKYQSLDFVSEIKNKSLLKTFLKDIINFLGKHFDRKVIVLVDEYDVPLSKAAKYGYYEDMLPLVRGFLSDALKPNLGEVSYLKKAVLTGCLRVGKESIFTDLNNFSLNTVVSEDLDLSEAIGFTTSEVKELLCYYGLDNRFNDVQNWYDGYRFSSSEIYCPWDVINFCSHALKSKTPQTFTPKNYWINTSNNDILETFLGFLSGEETEKMQALLDGKTIEVTVNETVNYDDLKRHDPNDFWTLLLFTGYLTIAERLRQSSVKVCVRIPNEEIRQTFKDKVIFRFSKKNEEFVNSGREIASTLLAGNTSAFRSKLTELLQNYVSIRDTATRSPAENFYHGFLSAIFVSSGSFISNFHSNAEAGEGYADILFTSADEEVGVVIEIKRCEKREDSIVLAEKALTQIKEKGYEQYFRGYPCKVIHAYGLVFFAKNCNVVMQSYKVESN